MPTRLPRLTNWFDHHYHVLVILIESIWQVGAAFGAAGQRCMALSTAVFVGEAQKWIPDLVELSRKLKVNAGKGVYHLYVS
jgi:hypothetical protein